MVRPGTSIVVQPLETSRRIDESVRTDFYFIRHHSENPSTILCHHFTDISDWILSFERLRAPASSIALKIITPVFELLNHSQFKAWVRETRHVLSGYYILASCCTVLFNGFCRLCFRLRAALLCWFSLSFTTCFGLHGHLRCFAAFFVLFVLFYQVQSFSSRFVRLKTLLNVWSLSIHVTVRVSL
jgi:hypothetical protein